MPLNCFVFPRKNGALIRNEIRRVILQRMLGEMAFPKDIDAQRKLDWICTTCLRTEAQPNTRQAWATKLLGSKNISAHDFQALCAYFRVELAASPSHICDVKTCEGLVLNTGAGSIAVVVANAWNATVPETRIVRPATAQDNLAHFQSVIEAVDVLIKSAVEIKDWVVDGLHTIVGVMAADGYDFSQSDPKFRGSAIISVNRRPIDIAEMLAHEASHQHFFMLQQLSRLVINASSETLYSPITNMQRPTIKVLLGYHAAANILHFYERLIASDGGAPLTKRRDVIKDMCTVFETELDRSRDLTPDGIFIRDQLKGLTALKHDSHQVGGGVLSEP